MNTTPSHFASNVGWDAEDSSHLYQIHAWGGGYFAVNATGHVVVRPDQQDGREIDLHEVVEGLKARDLTAPFRHSLLRHHRSSPTQSE
jgi:arginine decarboxylase